MIQEAVNLKECCRCGEGKPYSCFVKDKNRPDGFYAVCKDCRRGYYLANRDRVCSQMRDYRKKNKATIDAKQKQYISKRFFWKTFNNLRGRSFGKCASHIELARLWKAQRGMCALTKRMLTRENAQLDHIIPMIKGGSGDISNLRWVHRDVNYAKRDLSDAEFIALCREIITANPTK